MGQRGTGGRGRMRRAALAELENGETDPRAVACRAVCREPGYQPSLPELQSARKALYALARRGECVCEVSQGRLIARPAGGLA